MRVLIRTDASIEIGTGHLMRCLALAKEISIQGSEVTFACREFEGNKISFLKEEGFQVIALADNKNFNCKQDAFWIERHWNQDAMETVNMVKKMGISFDLVIVDHYGLDFRWENSMRKQINKIMVIDDLANRMHDCDILLDQTFGETGERYRNLLSRKTVKMLGVNYCLLRQQFRDHQKNIFKFNKDKIKIHMFFGGVDLQNYTEKYSELLLSNFNNIEIKAAVGRDYKYKSNLKILSKKFPDRFSWEQDVKNMAVHMQQCEVAFGAPGMATWERACIGLPSFYLAIHKNQIPILKKLDQKKLSVYLGDASNIDLLTVVSRIESLFLSPLFLEQLFYNSINNVDGLGTKSVVQKLIKVIEE